MKYAAETPPPPELDEPLDELPELLPLLLDEPLLAPKVSLNSEGVYFGWSPEGSMTSRYEKDPLHHPPSHIGSGKKLTFPLTDWPRFSSTHSSPLQY